MNKQDKDIPEILCIYHKNCIDGFGSAWVIDSAFKDCSNVLKFYAANYNEIPPDVTNKIVYIVDFSYPLKVIKDMAKLAQEILIIDHHKTAKDLLVDLPKNVSFVFDETKSGALLTWETIYPNIKPPYIIDYISDYDTWQFKLPFSKEINLALRSYVYKFIVWDELCTIPKEELISEGTILKRQFNIDVDNILKNYKLTRTIIRDYLVPIINLQPKYASEVGNILAKGYPFSISYYINGDICHFSLRSDETGIDVAKIAESYGGGGHKHAAGFQLNNFLDVSQIL